MLVGIAVTVTIPAETADTVRLSPKSMVPAVPTVDPESFITTPEPDPITPVSPEPSPINDVAVKIPLTNAPELFTVSFMELFGAIEIGSLPEVLIMNVLSTS